MAASGPSATPTNPKHPTCEARLSDFSFHCYPNPVTESGDLATRPIRPLQVGGAEHEKAGTAARRWEHRCSGPAANMWLSLIHI